MAHPAEGRYDDSGAEEVSRDEVDWPADGRPNVIDRSAIGEAEGRDPSTSPMLDNGFVAGDEDDDGAGTPAGIAQGSMQDAP